MTTRLEMTRWMVLALSLVLGVLIAIALMGQHAAPWQVAVSVLVVVGYGAAVQLLQRRSDVAQLLAGRSVDERWSMINERALSLAAQATAVVLVVAFLVATFVGGDAMPYAWVGAVLALSYLGGIAWYRARM
ncbi:MAG TPA: hypothetical protein VMT69_04520 [Kineosporiaceae bacterium]|nr:hypothetical protein [Kineosporiaceae bacterium]